MFFICWLHSLLDSTYYVVCDCYKFATIQTSIKETPYIA